MMNEKLERVLDFVRTSTLSVSGLGLGSGVSAAVVGVVGILDVIRELLSAGRTPEEVEAVLSAWRDDPATRLSIDEKIDQWLADTRSK